MQSEEYKRIMERCRVLVEDRLKGIEKERSSGDHAIESTLKNAMFYSLEAGGKRLRPCLAIAVCELLGGDAETVMPIACGLEMIHTYSLIHDDLPCMDNDDFRRGKPSNHKVFGEAMALLAGDGLLSLAFEVMLNGSIGLPVDKLDGYLKAVSEVAARAGAAGMVSGQAADIEFEGMGGDGADERTLRYIHTHKTADMLCAAVLGGAYAAGADENTVAALSVYAEKLGLLFQITDDLLDYKGDFALVGKTLGKDAAEDKLTFVTLYGEEGARDAAAHAADEAKAAVSGLENNGLLIAAVDDILYRSF